MRKWIALFETEANESLIADVYAVVSEYVTAGEGGSTRKFNEVYEKWPRPAEPMTLYRVLRLQPYQMDDFRAGEGFPLKPQEYSSWTKSLDSAKLLAATKGHNTIILTHTFPPEEIVIDVDDFYSEHELHHLTEYRKYVEAEQEVIVRHLQPFVITQENARAFEHDPTPLPQVGDEAFYFNEEDPYTIEAVDEHQPNASRGIYYVRFADEHAPVRFIGDYDGKNQWEVIDHLLHEMDE